MLKAHLRYGRYMVHHACGLKAQDWEGQISFQPILELLILEYKKHVLNIYYSLHLISFVLNLFLSH